jgi:hypothetical protein
VKIQLVKPSSFVHQTGFSFLLIIILEKYKYKYILKYQGFHGIPEERGGGNCFTQHSKVSYHFVLAVIFQSQTEYGFISMQFTLFVNV